MIHETTTVAGRTLVAGDVYAVHFPSEHGEGEWRIVARLDLPPAVVYTEAAARAWLDHLAGELQERQR